MNVRDFFRLSESSGISTFAEAQVHLFRRNAALQDYFHPLQLNHGKLSTTKTPERSFASRVSALVESGGYELVRHIARRKYKADVLYCPSPYFARRTENELSVRTLMALAQTDATILCLLAGNAPFRAEIEAKLHAAGRFGQVTLLDPTAALNPLAHKLLFRAGRIRGSAAFDEIVEVLRPHGLAPPLESRSAFSLTALCVEAWNYVEPRIEFEAAVTRCHWYDLCSSVCRTARQRGKPVITFQQGVIGHTLDVPVTATKYVTFGNSSAGLLARMNRSFFEAVGVPERVVEFIPGGSIFDNIVALPNQFLNKTLLIIDEPVGEEDFYGIGHQRKAILQLAEKLLKSSAPPKIIIRPHPYWDTIGLDEWKALILRYPSLCELSHAVWTLQDDLMRSSVVLGIFSGALTVAAASGLPTFFMATEPGYATEDLACFRAGQTFTPDDALREINRVLADEQSFAEARSVALGNAREYYYNGARLELDAAFFERVFRNDRIPFLSVGAKQK